MKESFFFPHDYVARNDPKMIDLMCSHGVAGIGVFWCIVEQLYEAGGRLPLANCKSIAFALHTECNIVTSVVQDFDLFKNDGEMFWSDSVLRRINKRISVSESRKKAAAARWQNANAEQKQCKNHPTINIEITNEKDSSSNEEEREKPTKRFVPPTLEEVKNFIVEKGYSVDAESFIAFYQSKNWYVGKNKMKDWKAAILTWEKREKENPRRASRKTVNPNANDEWQ